MKRILITFGFLLALTAPGLAQAPDVTWVITRNGTPVGGMVLTAAQSQRFLVWAIAQRKGTVVQTPAVVGVPAVLNPDGSVLTPAVVAAPAVMRDPTAAEIVPLIAEDMLSQMRNQATQWYRGGAAQTASDAVAPVAPK